MFLAGAAALTGGYVGVDHFLAAQQKQLFSAHDSETTLGWHKFASQQPERADQLRRSVVRISTGGISSGSGVLLDSQGRVALTAHEYAENRTLEGSLYPALRESASAYALKPLVIDKAHDVLIAQIVSADGQPLPPWQIAATGALPARFSEKSEVAPGNKVMLLGFPEIADDRLHLSIGAVTAKPAAYKQYAPDGGQLVETQNLQAANAVVNSSMSGGPVFAGNKLVGIISGGGAFGLRSGAHFAPLSSIQPVYEQARQTLKLQSNRYNHQP